MPRSFLAGAQFRSEVRLLLSSVQPTLSWVAFLPVLALHGNALLSLRITGYKQPLPSLYRQHYRAVWCMHLANLYLLMSLQPWGEKVTKVTSAELTVESAGRTWKKIMIKN